MIYFVEPSIEKKIKLAEYLYIDSQFETTYLQEKLAISKSTLERYIKEINEAYAAENHNGTLYNTVALEKIGRDLLDQSVLLALFKEIVFNPGKSSANYREKLLLAPATFARLMTQLKEILAHFKMTIVISNGYWIEATSEYEYIILIAGIMNLFKTDKTELVECLTETEREIYQKKISQNIYAMNTFEREILNNIFLMTLVREKQCRLAKKQTKILTLDCVSTYLLSVYDQNWLETYDRYTSVIDTLYHDKIKSVHRRKFVELLVRTAFYTKLLPYSLEVLDFKQDFFVRKMYVERPKRRETLENLICRLSGLLDMDFTFRKNTLIYHIVSSNLLLFEYEQQFKLFIHSNLGPQHEEFLIETAEQLKLYFPNLLSVMPLTEGEYSDDGVVVTNEQLNTEQFPNQYLVSDFLTFTEFTEFILWLKRTTEITVVY